MASRKNDYKLRKQIASSERIDLNGTLEEVNIKIQAALANFGPTATIYYDCDSDYDGCYDTYSIISYYRDETDKEYNARVAKHEKAIERAKLAKKKKEEKLKEKIAKDAEMEKALYESLKLKYEKISR